MTARKGYLSVKAVKATRGKERTYKVLESRDNVSRIGVGAILNQDDLDALETQLSFYVVKF